MGAVECVALEGLSLWFNSSDHLPPHLHVERVGHWEYRVFFLREGDAMLEKKWGRSDPTSAERKRILSAATTHRVALLNEWHRKVKPASPGPTR